MSGQNSPFPLNLREGVIWAYRHLLGREPNSEADVTAHLVHTAQSLRSAFMNSAEYRALSGQTPTAAALAALVDQFQPFATEPPVPGSWRDFLGVQTRCSFLPDICLPWAGTVLSAPGRGISGVHDEAEWLGTLRSVLEARVRFVVVELGAGWAPWLVSGAKAAERVGIQDLLLIGVEGSVGHVAFMRQHMLDNGIDPARHRVVHGVVGIKDGIAYFPKLAQPKDNYGAEANYSRADNAAEMDEVPSISLPTLLADVTRVDILHCDIQGMEGEVFRAAQATVNAKVARVVVGTHSRAVEGELQAQFSANGWLLEADAACQYVQVPGGTLLLSLDGTQVWRNPRLTAGV
jgi:FkbM family methyltransferase